MKTLLYYDIKKMGIENREIPQPNEHEVLVRVKACGVCGTDVHIFNGMPGSAEVTPPIVLGHEFAGEVVQIGRSVKALSINDRVAIDPNIYCGICEYCRSGKKHLCDHLEAIGVTRDGGMAEYCIVPENQCIKVSNNLSYYEAAMIEPLSCVLHGIELLSIKSESEILIIGGGFIGSMFLQMMKQTSKRVDIVEIDESKHLALSQYKPRTILKDLQHVKASYDIIIECVGKAITVEMGIKKAKKGAQILLFGVANPNALIQISPYEIFQKELNIIGSFINPDTVCTAEKLLADRIIDVEGLISHKLSLEEVPNTLLNYPSLKINKAVIYF